MTKAATAGKRKEIKTVSDLTPDSRNANKGTPRGLSALDYSLRDGGAGRSGLADKNGKMIAGNKTLERVADLGLKIKPVHTNGNEWVVVIRDDLDLDTDKRAKRMAIADNRVGEISLDWDEVVLQEIADGERELLDGLFTAEELAAAGVEVDQVDDDEHAADLIDRAAELQKVWGVKTGDLWRVGDHFLLCGDSTKREDVERVMGGEKAGMMVTDPPYGVNYDPAWRDELDKSQGRWKGVSTRALGVVVNDDRDDWSEAWALFAGDVAYVWHSGLHLEVAKSLLASGFSLRSQIIWVKQSGVFGRSDYHWQHEPCWYCVRVGGTGHWAGDRTQTTVWEIRNNAAIGDVTKNEVATGHGTQKPLECMARPIRNHDFEMVYDPFAGSGTTGIACHSLNRKARLIEISENYCAVILQRFTDSFSGIKIERIT